MQDGSNKHEQSRAAKNDKRRAFSEERAKQGAGDSPSYLTAIS